MKKTMKIGLILIAVGLVGVLISKLTVATNISSDEVLVYEIIDYKYNNEFGNIEFDIENNDIEIGVSPDQYIYIKTQENEINIVSVEQGEDLKFGIYSTNTLNVNFFSGHMLPVVEVLLPKDLSSNVSIITSGGNIDVSGVDLNQIDFKTKDGDIAIDQSKVTGESKVETANGNAELSNLTAADNLTVISANGDYTLENIKVGILDLKTRNGKLYLKGLETTGSLTVESVNGDIEIDNLVAGGQANFKTVNGTINGFAVLPKLGIKASSVSGDIEFELASPSSDYTILLDTETGNQNIITDQGNQQEPGSGDIEVKIESTNGNILVKDTI